MRIINMEKISLSHGSGGSQSQKIISDIFLKAFNNPVLNALDDAATIESNMAFTTDSFVIKPIFFPGGDIGKLAVCGTVNDLSMKGSIPKYLTSSFIIGEGFDIGDLKKIVASMAKEAKNAGVTIVAGDTKIIDPKDRETIYINTAGIGFIQKGINISSKNAKPGDQIILSGNIGDHGVAVLNARSDFGFKGLVNSDCACLNEIIQTFVSKEVRVLRDPTRGGVASALNEIAASSKAGIIINSTKIPVNKTTKQACALLGLDPLHIANEGKFLAIVSSKSADKILSKIRSHKLGRNAEVIGEVVKGNKDVFVRTSVGGLRPLFMLEGDQLPRIC